MFCVFHIQGLYQMYYLQLFSRIKRFFPSPLQLYILLFSRTFCALVEDFALFQGTGFPSWKHSISKESLSIRSLSPCCVPDPPTPLCPDGPEDRPRESPVSWVCVLAVPWFPGHFWGDRGLTPSPGGWVFVGCAWRWRTLTAVCRVDELMSSGALPCSSLCSLGLVLKKCLSAP